jgi:hypothetical protein
LRHAAAGGARHAAATTAHQTRGATILEQEATAIPHARRERD